MIEFSRPDTLVRPVETGEKNCCILCSIAAGKHGNGEPDTGESQDDRLSGSIVHFILQTPVLSGRFQGVLSNDTGKNHLHVTLNGNSRQFEFGGLPVIVIIIPVRIARIPLDCGRDLLWHRFRIPKRRLQRDYQSRGACKKGKYNAYNQSAHKQNRP